MKYRWLGNPRAILLSLLVTVLLFVVACGSAAEPVTEPQQDSTSQQAKPTIAEPVAAATVAPPTVAPTQSPQDAAMPTPEPEATAAPEPAMTDKSGGFINMSQYADVRQRLIHQSSVLDMNLYPMFNTVVEFDPETPDQSALRCDLCTDWTLADDGMTYTFNIHPEATWWDGVPVTADDIVFSMESMVNPDQFPVLEGRSTSSHCNAELYYESGEARAIDAKTVEIKTKFPSGGFLTTIAVPTCMIQAKHTVVDQGIPQGGKDLEVINGSGPFKFVEYQKEISVEYTKNQDYWKEGMPHIDGMKHFIIPDPGRVIAAYKTGQVLASNQPLTNLSPKEALKLDEEMDNLTVHWGGPAAAMYIMMNTTKAPFNDARVRRAISLAVDRQAIIDTISGGIHLLGTPNPPGLWYTRPEEEITQFPGFRTQNGAKHPDDLALAQELVAQAGVGTGEGVKITLNARNCCSYPDVATLVKQQLVDAFGWDITLEVLESGAGFDRYWAGDYSIAVQGGSITSSDPDIVWARMVRGTTPQWLGGGRGKRFVPAGLEELYDQQIQETNPEVRAEIVQQMADIIVNEDAANPYIYWDMRHWPVEHRIQNFNYTSRANKWEHVWCDPAC